MPEQHLSVARVVAICSVIAVSACSSSGDQVGPRTTTASLPTGTQQNTNQRYWQENSACWAAVDQKYNKATDYYTANIVRGTKDGRFNKALRADFLKRSDERRQCRFVYLDNTKDLLELGFADLNRRYLMESAEQDRSLADGHLSFVQYRNVHATLEEKLSSELAAIRTRTREATRQRVAEQAEEDARQAQADADKQEETNSRNAAMMGMMMGMMNQPTDTSGRRAPTYTPSTAFNPGYQASAGTSGNQDRCPPPTVSRSPRDGQMNAGWITVNSNCNRTVTVDIHTVSLYQTRPRTEQTQSVQIGRTASFWCDGKREGCVVEMVGYH